jgi:hypothetical protein
MKKKLLLLLAVLALCCLAWTPGEASCPPSCDTYCPGKPGSAICGCPKWTDRPCRTVTCGSWNRVGGCWYE